LHGAGADDGLLCVQVGEHRGSAREHGTRVRVAQFGGDAPQGAATAQASGTQQVQQPCADRVENDETDRVTMVTKGKDAGRLA
jgi:hypothetical protein